MSKTVDHWEKIKEEPFRAGFRKLVKKTFKLPSGQIQEFYIKHEGPAVCILALTKANNVILAKQFRPGLEEYLLELPGGFGGDEDPQVAIKRELLEETGYIGDVEFVGTSFDDAYSTMVRQNFVATNCRKVQTQELDETEFIDVIEMPLKDFRNHLRSGKLTDIETGYLGLDYLKLL